MYKVPIRLGGCKNSYPSTQKPNTAPPPVPSTFNPDVHFLILPQAKRHAAHYSHPPVSSDSPSLAPFAQIVAPTLSSQASLLETVSNDFFGLPMVSPSATAARAATYFSSGARTLGGWEGSYLLGVQPDVFLEMEALATLILDMKTERDLDRGWWGNKRF